MASADDTPTPGRWLTASQVAEAMQVSTAHVYTLARNGKLAHVKLGGCVRFPPDILETIEQASRAAVDPARHAQDLELVRRSRRVTKALRHLRAMPNRWEI